MKEKIAIGVSILSFVILYMALNAVADSLGVPTYVDFGETITVTRGAGRTSYDEDIDGATTDVGLFILAASVMLAWRVYHWIISGKLGGNLKGSQKIIWSYWFVGLTTYILVTTPIWHLDIAEGLQRLLITGIGVGMAVLLYKKYQKAIYEEKQRSAVRPDYR